VIISIWILAAETHVALWPLVVMAIIVLVIINRNNGGPRHRF
jgi:hypothetical protein